jgi:hypothetical protein
MLHEWHEFYMLLGTAATTLVALLFVAVSIGVGLLSATRSVATRVYMSPIILHYSVVLFVSLIALVPALGDFGQAVVIAFSGIVGLAYSSLVTSRLLRDRGRVEAVDHFGYGIGPFFGYAGIVAGGTMMVEHEPHGPELLAGALVLLLMVNIRNAWDLAVTFAQRHADGQPPRTSSN